MIQPADDSDFSALHFGVAPAGLRPADSPVGPPEVLEMLRGVAASIRPGFAPAAWMIVEDDEVVGLCSIVKPPADGEIHIGYGVAPTRRGQGVMSRAISALLEWAVADPRVAIVSAETSVNNPASQRVLERNGFIRVGARHDAEDGDLICWRTAVSG